ARDRKLSRAGALLQHDPQLFDAFLACFSARFSFSDFAGFFFSSFFRSMPLLMTRSSGGPAHCAPRAKVATARDEKQVP
ncbi:MAG TPA: hypothetical protein VFH71_05945, partial [Rhodanobacteraceae bacterium]|nr:hypothetical protein [Rhodanobacteraceae bacterium]